MIKNYRRRSFYEASDAVDYQQKCKDLIKQLISHASKFTYEAWGHDGTVIISSGEYLEMVNAFDDGNCNYLQYEPWSGKVLANIKNMSLKECAELLESLVDDYI